MTRHWPLSIYSMGGWGLWPQYCLSILIVTRPSKPTNGLWATSLWRLVYTHGSIGPDGPGKILAAQRCVPPPPLLGGDLDKVAGTVEEE